MSDLYNSEVNIPRRNNRIILNKSKSTFNNKEENTLLFLSG